MRFRLAGFPVEIHPSFFILAVLLGLGAGDVRLILLWVAVVFVSILTHELGHAIVGRSYGLQPQIRLYSMGGLTSWSSGRGLTPRQSILVSLSGPAAGLALGGLVYGFSVLEPIELTPMGSFVVFLLLQVNIVWSILNLLPIVPLDGGNVMRSLLFMFRGQRDERMPAMVSMVVAAALFVLALSVGRTFGAMMAAWLAFSNYQTFKGETYGARFPGMGR